MGLYDQISSAQDALGHLHQATAGAMAAQKIAQRDYEQAQAEVEKWERRIQLALQAGREDLAREALFRRNFHQDTADKLKALIDQHILKVDTLKRNLTSWEGKVSTAKNELLLTERNTSSAISSFERMKEKILQMEARVQAVPEQDDANGGSEFITFDDFEDIDAESKRLREQVLGVPTSLDQAADAKDPEEILEEAIQQTRQAVASAVASKEGIQQQYNQARIEAKNRHQQAQLALQKDDENLAFQALIGKTVQGKVATALKTQLEQQEATVKLLKRNLAALEKAKHMLEIEAKLVEMKAQLLDCAIPQKTYLLPAAYPSDQVVDSELE